ncbi:TPA: hypothetical protein DCG86_05085 [Candidatus Marinimicrobia bacterium]|nr:hypothetical protein [Candidatus Neomarinimicrobiota bacterium]
MNTYLDRIRDTYQTVGNLLEKGLAVEGLNIMKYIPADIRDHVVIRYLKGVCQQESGAAEMAEYYFRSVIHEDPGFISAAEALLYMRDNMLTDGEKAYLCELIGWMKPDSDSLEDIRDSLAGVAPEPLKLHEKPEETSSILHSHTGMDKTEPKKEEEASEEIPIFQKIQGDKSETSSDKVPDFTVKTPEKEKNSYLGDILIDLKKKASDKETHKPDPPQKVDEEEKEPILDIHLSPEEEAEIEREEELEESELLSDSEEASKLKELLKTLHERKHRDIEDQSPESTETASQEEDLEAAGPFDTLTMAKVYFKQGAYSSALRILGLLKKSTSDNTKLKEIETLADKVREKIEAEKAE